MEGVPSKSLGTLRDNLAETRVLPGCSSRSLGWRFGNHVLSRLFRRCQDKSLVEFTLETGRKNQIRAQIAGLGHPIVGDRKYGATAILRGDWRCIRVT